MCGGWMVGRRGRGIWLLRLQLGDFEWQREGKERVG